jgi:hypothetical protein
LIEQAEWRALFGNRLLGEVSDRFRESRTEVTISGRLFQKADGNSQFPDRFGKSCPEIGKVGRKSQKLSNIPESRTEIGNSSQKFSKSDRILDFRPTFSEVVRNFKKSGALLKSQTAT